MFFRSVKCTCKNTVMKESVRNFYLDNFDRWTLRRLL